MILWTSSLEWKVSASNFFFSSSKDFLYAWSWDTSSFSVSKAFERSLANLLESLSFSLRSFSFSWRTSIYFFSNSIYSSKRPILFVFSSSELLLYLYKVYIFNAKDSPLVSYIHFNYSNLYCSWSNSFSLTSRRPFTSWYSCLNNSEDSWWLLISCFRISVFEIISEF